MILHGWPSANFHLQVFSHNLNAVRPFAEYNFFLGFRQRHYDASHINPIPSINLRFMQTPSFITMGGSVLIRRTVEPRGTNWMLCLAGNTVTRFPTLLTRGRRCRWLLALRHRIVSGFAIALQTTIIEHVSRLLYDFLSHKI